MHPVEDRAKNDPQVIPSEYSFAAHSSKKTKQDSHASQSYEQHSRNKDLFAFKMHIICANHAEEAVRMEEQWQ